MRLDDQELSQLKVYFAGQPVKQAYLFGSFARGVADERSDVDILVELDHSRPIGRLHSNGPRLGSAVFTHRGSGNHQRLDPLSEAERGPRQEIDLCAQLGPTAHESTLDRDRGPAIAHAIT